MKNNIKIMKKCLALFVALIISVQMLLAVPAGIYRDDRGRRVVLIQSDGTIYCFDNEGNVRSTWRVVREDPDGRFYIKLVVNGQVAGYENSDNAWWSENGQIYLNLANQMRTLVKE